MKIVIRDNSKEVLATLQDACIRALEECGLTAEGYAKKAAPVDTGNLRNSISHAVDDEKKVMYIGTNTEYAPYVELGTGKYVAGGRPTPWVYMDDEGKFHYTHGNKAQPFIKPSIADHQSAYKAIIESELKNG